MFLSDNRYWLIGHPRNRRDLRTLTRYAAKGFRPPKPVRAPWIVFMAICVVVEVLMAFLAAGGITERYDWLIPLIGLGVALGGYFLHDFLESKYKARLAHARLRVVNPKKNLLFKRLTEALCLAKETHPNHEFDNECCYDILSRQKERVDKLLSNPDSLEKIALLKTRSLDARQDEALRKTLSGRAEETARRIRKHEERPQLTLVVGRPEGLREPVRSYSQRFPIRRFGDSTRS